MKPGPKPKDPAILFWDKVSKGAPDECWEWIGSRSQKGYGQGKWHGQSRQAHRMAYEIHYGKIPAGMMVLHRCDNPPCCNPDHLWLGTARDNTGDMVNKGRNYIRERHTHCARGHEFTEENTHWIWRKKINYLARRCKQCHREDRMAWHWRTKEARQFRKETAQ